MKKILSFVLLLILCLSLCACGDEKEPPASSTPSNTTPPKRITIEITTANWQEYFALTYDSDPEKITCEYGTITIYNNRRRLTLKSPYDAFYVEDMDLSMEYLCTGGYDCRYDYNPATGIASMTCPIRYVPDLYGKLRLTKKHIGKGEYVFGAIRPETLVIGENKASVENTVYARLDVTAVHGTITLRRRPASNS